MRQGFKTLTVLPDAQALAEAAAMRVVQALAQGSGLLSVCLAGGATPARLYHLLAMEPFHSAVPWDRVHWFWGDERFVPRDDSRSNAGMVCRLLLDRVDAPAENIHPVPSGAADEEQAARLYEAELRGFYGADAVDPGRPLFDVVLLGLGGDGHTASLFPGRPELDATLRWVVGVPEPALEPFVPRVTLTLPVLASTRDMLFLVSGREKRRILARIMAGADLPAARAYSHGDLAWLIDSDAMPENRHVA
jgi:6-phosphogluconolactonase